MEHPRMSLKTPPTPPGQREAGLRPNAAGNEGGVA